MESYIRAGTTKTPTVEFNENGHLQISGNSYMEDPYAYYSQLTDWIAKFLETNNKEVSLNIYLKFINTSSTKCIFNLMSMLNKGAKTKIKVVWEFEIDDDDMQEVGEDLQSLTKMDFVFKKRSNNN